MGESPSGVRISPSPQPSNQRPMKLKQIFFVTFLFLLGYTFASNQIGYVYYEDGASFIKNNKVLLIQHSRR